ncbi:tyrosine-type recombinase/integrase [Bradyrhizobium sp. CCH5-F6]|jgi:site-specific recombinase XerD|uniref:tyrosine-type recombinase/integrase n=1 Tax=Bradyrhizobium sp. CCH5-F6 TaxID=1768753 RepID=UPI00076A9E52|nr:tyrosine-type recombinase/integrase [Bradyrhizobium sp. CCH5-F6]
MTTELIVQTTSLPSVMEELRERAGEYVKNAHSKNTQRAYKTDWEHFETWCLSHDRTCFPADVFETIVPYLTAHAGALKVSTLLRRLTAIRVIHRARGTKLDTSDERFRVFWQGLRNKHRVRPTKKAPLMSPDLRRAIQALPPTLQGHRDRALLLIGFAAGLRRSELAGLWAAQDAEAPGWIEETSDGLVVQLASSKTNQAGEEEIIGVPFGKDETVCPVRAYRAWLAISGIATGPVFRPISRHGKMASAAITGAGVALVVKRVVGNMALAEGLTLDKALSLASTYSGHSLRSGLATSAAKNRAPGHAIQRQLRHKSFATTLEYIRIGSLFEGNAASFALE